MVNISLFKKKKFVGVKFIFKEHHGTTQPRNQTQRARLGDLSNNLPIN